MNFDRMRELILDKAIRGQLVPQLPEDGTVDQIGDAPSEVPFDIPSSWKWVRLDDIGDYKKGPFGSSLTKSIFVPKSNDVVRVYEQKNAIDKDSEWVRYYITKDYYKEKMTSFTVSGGDIIISCAGTIGEVYVLPDTAEVGVINQALMRVRLKQFVMPDYFKVVFDSLIKQLSIKESGGTAIKNIPPFKVFKAFKFPLPPHAEQKRIASRVAELFAEIDRAEKAYEELQTLAKVLRGQILQEAIQGKLVPQLPEDGAVEQMGKAPSEVPFAIPSSWKWERLSELVDVRDGTHDSPKYVENGIPFVTSKNLKNGSIDFSTVKFISHKDHEEFIKRSHVEPGDILMAMIGSIGNALIVPESLPEFSIKNVALFKKIEGREIDFKYLLTLLRGLERMMLEQSSGSVQKFVPLKYLRNLPIPLPPLAEQKRIVAKVEQLLEHVDAMVS